ncbi:MAG TPA: DNA glycosylase [Fimbriimonadaceae bacterium]|nr:DNA glycosylase [Fimbriimonadaceae bacterium]HRJ32682.1 DNA glycosylase [Fimbriimonadaceae bacterium]
MTRFLLPISKDELDLDLTLDCGQVFSWWHLNGSWVGLDGNEGFCLRQSATEIEVITTSTQDHFFRLFQLHSSQREFQSYVLERDADFAEPFHRYPGLRILQPNDPVPVFFCFMCSSNNHLSRIRSMVQTLYSLSSQSLAISEHTLRVFPSIETLAGTSEKFLREQGFGYRGATLPAAAQELLSRGGQSYLQELRTWTYCEAHAALRSIPGIGPKLADCILLFGLGFGEAVPVDTHLWQQAVQRYFPEWHGKALTPGRYQAVGDHLRSLFGDQSGWAHEYLFVENLRRNR